MNTSKTIDCPVFGKPYRISFAIGTREEVDAFLKKKSPKKFPKGLSPDRSSDTVQRNNLFTAVFVEAPNYTTVASRALDLARLVLAEAKKDNSPAYDPDKTIQLKAALFESLNKTISEWLNQ